EDIRFHNSNNTNEFTLTDTDINNKALIHLQSILSRHEKSLTEFPNMPILDISADICSLIDEEKNYNIDELTQILENGIPQLNEEQNTIFNKVIVRLSERIAIAVASSGIASLLLP
ncbi:602_t:CDS:2, partial [Cetraspora pellucida]